MRSTIFLPKKIKVGYQKRDDTYTKMLAYIIYYDEKGTLRKEKSWNSWRDKTIDNNEFDNIPTSGFVLNKKAGGYDTGWNHRQTYCRVFDPRGFEFEITIPNLLYILENATSTKGKGLEGEFVYGWDGTELVLIPCDSPDYKILTEYNEKLQNKVKLKGKDLIIGGTYRDKSNNQLIYIGRYDYTYKNYRKGGSPTETVKKYYFAHRTFDKYRNCDTVSFIDLSGLSSIIEVISESCCDDYAELFGKFEYHEYYNPHDKTKDEYIPHTLDSFTNLVENKVNRDRSLSYWRDERTSTIKFYTNGIDKIKNFEYGWNDDCTTNPRCEYSYMNQCFVWNIYETTNYPYQRNRKEITMTIEEFFNEFNPHYKKEYLKDGKLRRISNYE